MTNERGNVVNEEVFIFTITQEEQMRNGGVETPFGHFNRCPTDDDNTPEKMEENDSCLEFVPKESEIINCVFDRFSLETNWKFTLFATEQMLPDIQQGFRQLNAALDYTKRNKQERKVNNGRTEVS